MVHYSSLDKPWTARCNDLSQTIGRGQAELQNCPLCFDQCMPHSPIIPSAFDVFRHSGFSLFFRSDMTARGLSCALSAFLASATSTREFEETTQHNNNSAAVDMGQAMHCGSSLQQSTGQTTGTHDTTQWRLATRASACGLEVRDERMPTYEAPMDSHVNEGPYVIT